MRDVVIIGAAMKRPGRYEKSIIEMGTACDQHDLVPACSEPGSYDRADRTGADNGDSHAECA